MSQNKIKSFGGFVVNNRIKTIAICFFSVAIALVISSVKGFKFGVDFAGGSVIDFAVTEQDLSVDVMYEKVGNVLPKGSYTLQQQGQERWVCGINKSVEMSIEEIKTTLSNIFTGIQFLQVENVGPQVSGSLLKQATWAIVFSFISIVMYMSVRFNWHLAVSGVIALVLDLLATVSMTSFASMEINLTVISAFLTIIGYCVNDTVVLYDRIRSNIVKSKAKTSDSIASALNSVLRRSILTSVVTLLSLVGMIIFLDGSIQDFAIIVSFGIVFGTFASLFVSSVLPIFFKMEVSDLITKKKVERDPEFYAR